MFLYWIKSAKFNNIWSEGYVGVSKNPTRRFLEHKQSRVNFIIKAAYKTYEDMCLEIIYEGSEEECLAAELLFRPTEYIGWNITKGGSYPPEKPALGKRWKIKDTSKYKKVKSDTHKRNISLGQLGSKRSPLDDEWKRTISNSLSKLKWFNNGKENKRLLFCPEGFVPGRIIIKEKGKNFV